MSYSRTATSYQRLAGPTVANRRQQSSSWTRNQNRVAFTSNIKMGPVTHTVLVALMITVLGLIYLTQATRATSYDYEAQAVDEQITELSIQKDDLAVENARLTAIQSVQNSNVAKNMSKPADTKYVSE